MRERTNWEKKGQREALSSRRGAPASSGFRPSPPSYPLSQALRPAQLPDLLLRWAGEGPRGLRGGWRRREASLTRAVCALSPAPCLSASMLLPHCSTPSAGHTPTSLLSPRAFWTLSAAPLPSWSESKRAFSSRSWIAPWKRYGAGAARRGCDSEPGTAGVRPGLWG